MLCDLLLISRKGPLMYGEPCDYGVTRRRAEVTHSVSTLSRSRSACAMGPSLVNIPCQGRSNISKAICCTGLV